MRSKRTINIYRDRRYRRARRRAIKRAGRQCERCDRAGKLTAHHKTPLAAGGAPFDIDNLIVLCRPCHDAAHGR